MKLALHLLFFVSIITACKPTKMALDNANLSGTYTITAIKTNTNIANTLTLSFDDSTKQISGFTGCNSLFGTYTLVDKQLSFPGLGLTKRLCVEENANTTERLFVDALNKVNTYKIKDNKLLLLLDDTVLITAEKAEAKVLKSNEKKPTSKSDVVKTNYTKTLVTYKSFSRSDFDYIQISEKALILSKDKNLQDKSALSCKAEDWETIKTLLTKINLEDLQQLEAPTNQRLYDGAAHATLSITQGDVVVTTPSFDHGAPPKELETLVNKVLSIADNASKH